MAGPEQLLMKQLQAHLDALDPGPSLQAAQGDHLMEGREGRQTRCDLADLAQTAAAADVRLGED